MVDMDARQKAGIRPSTSEVKTHIAMMKSVGVNSCIHAHPPHCNAFLFAGQVPPSGINPEADIFLGHIPLAPYGTPGSLETARAVAEAAKQSTVVFMENHGVITGARDVEEAEWFMENADAYCRMVLMAGLHKAPPEPGGTGRRGGLPRHPQGHRLRCAGQPAPVQHGNLRRVQAGQIRQINSFNGAADSVQPPRFLPLPPPHNLFHHLYRRCFPAAGSRNNQRRRSFPCFRKHGISGSRSSGREN